ncbi:tonB-system energizer ExbB [Brucella tritici]|uniref:Biopolymer transport protein ExbB n=1 Tax=Brucella tritici TaxID=94626 RepID=A0A6N6QGV0_9HYPH|nr:tonB-system energizer ExbB [Brucella tritici]KAB2676038.1 tonB-system energizer ExbB [Brucella tritici]KAB2682332.1 tonB-system energizer ExbB [Brucella tritici]
MRADLNNQKAIKMTGFWRKGFMAAAMGIGLLGAASALAQNGPQDATPSTNAPVAPAAAAPSSPAPTNTAPAAAPAPSATTPAAAAPSPELIQSQTVAPAAAPVESESGLILPHDLSPWGMFMAADWVVKAVMIGLALASLATWTVWVAKTLELAGARRRATRALKVIGHSATLAEAVRSLDGAKGPGAILVRAAEDEVRLSGPALARAGGEGLKERVSSRLSRIEAKAGRRLSKGTGILATIGSVAPFVGLFGTVWGIMNSFINISQAQTTNLAVVAPGIAEALLATAIGLVAAIPAVVIYNVFARSITGYRSLLADASAGVERLVSRDLDFRTAGVREGTLHAAE